MFQLERHRMADPAVQAVLQEFQIDNPGIDLAQTRRSSHGEYLYNLHLVLVHEGRWSEVRRDRLEKSHAMLLSAARKKEHLLGRARILSDHMHIMVGCKNIESPADVALSYMNNIAYAHGMKVVFQYGFYVGTFGEYDRGAIRRSL